METDLLGCYDKASAWTARIVAGAADKLDAETPCDGWDVKTLLNHMLDTQRYFLESAHGKQTSFPAADPPDVVSDNPQADFEDKREAMLHAYGQPGVIEKTGSSLGIAASDLLLHGWDLAVATGQDATMPEGSAETAYNLIHGKFTEEQRKGIF